MSYLLVFLFSLLVPLSLHASYGVDVSLSSPLEQETDSGTVVTGAFFIKNTTSEHANFLIKLDLPEGWISIPFTEPFLSLEPWEQKLELVAIKIPKNTLGGTYKVRLIAQGQTNASLIGEESFLVHILEKTDCKSFIQKKPNHTLAGEVYKIEVVVINTGNVPTELFTKVTEHLDFPFSIDKKEFTIAPGDSETVTISVIPPKNTATSIKHFLSISVENSYGTSMCDALSTEVEIFPMTPPPIERYTYLPLETTFGYGMKNSQKQSFVELKGGGSIDEKKNIDLFIRAPFIQQANIDRNLGGPPENGYVHYFDSFSDLYAGDGIYEITPLTMLNRFGRGGSVSFKPSPITLKGVYVHDSSSIPKQDLGGILSYKPLDFFSVSLSSLLTRLNKKSENILQNKRQTATNSFSSEFEHAKIGNLTTEYSTSGSFFIPKKNHQGYYIYSKANPVSNVWYAAQKIYAGSDFVGYYQDTNQLYTSVGFPIIKRLQGTLSFNQIEYNLKKNRKEKSAPRNITGSGGLSYSFPFGLYTSLYYNNIHFKNALTNKGYKTEFLSVNGGKTFQKWTYQGIVETGHYQEKTKKTHSHFWQNYQLYTYYQPTARQQYAVYTKIGYIQLSENITWARVYGSSASISLKELTGQLVYEFSGGEKKRQYLSTKLRYTFKNKNQLELQGYANSMKNQKNTVEFLLSYTIPWRVPIRKNRSIGHIKGKVFYEQDKEIPASNLVIHCAGKKTISDNKGEFSFSSLKPGQYSLFAEEKELVTTSPSPLPVEVVGGESSNVRICFEHPALLSGSIPIYDKEDETLLLKGHLDGAIITLESAFLKERRVTTTDYLGGFRFEKLRPGRWILKVHPEKKPPYHYLEEEELLLDIFPGEEKSITINMLPIKREIRMIDSGTIE